MMMGWGRGSARVDGVEAGVVLRGEGGGGLFSDSQLACNIQNVVD